jgi:CheY-like chemotaxis protein
MKVESVIGAGTSFKLYFVAYNIAEPRELTDRAIIITPQEQEILQLDIDEDEAQEPRDKFDFDPSDFEEFDAFDIPEEKDDEESVSDDPPHIVLVDDDNTLRDALCAMLRRGGYESVRAFEKPREALSYIGENADHIQLMITDYRMPNMKGNVLVKEVEKIAPHIPVIMISGFSDHGFEDTLGDYPTIKQFLEKPLEKEKFLAHIRAVLAIKA